MAWENEYYKVLWKKGCDCFLGLNTVYVGVLFYGRELLGEGYGAVSVTFLFLLATHCPRLTIVPRLALVVKLRLVVWPSVAGGVRAQGKRAKRREGGGRL